MSRDGWQLSSSAGLAISVLSYGATLQTQRAPDSPNRPLFPSTVLLPGDLFASTTLFRFGPA